MSMIRQVPWQEFSKIVGNTQFNKFIQNGTTVVLFITDWSFPSRLALKRIKKLHFDKKRCGIIDVDLVDSIDLVDRFEIRSVPYCLLFKEGQVLSHVSGFRVEIFNEIFASLVSEYKAPKQQKAKNCPQGHNLQLCAILSMQLYPEGYFFCNDCRKIERCSTEKPVAHCEFCDYDLCVQCFSC